MINKMTVTQFVENLSMRYTGSNELKIMDVEEWVESKGLTETEIKKFEIIIKNNYEYRSFPSIRNLQDIYSSHMSNKKIDANDIYFPEKFINHVTFVLNLGIRDIIKKYIDFEKGQLRGDDMSCFERYFLYIFYDLINNYRVRLKNEYVSEHANKIQTEKDLQMLKNGIELIIEKEPDPTGHEKQELLEMCKGHFVNVNSKVAK